MMKNPTFFLTILLGLALVVPRVEARDLRAGGGGGARPQLSAPQRSPMTGSQVKRPAAKPEPKPAARPQINAPSRPTQQPAARPEINRPDIQRPSVQKPTTRPAMPETRPNLPDRPAGGGNARPNLPDRPAGGGNDRPSLPDRPAGGGGEGRPNLPGGGNAADRLPDKRPSVDRPAANRPSTLPGMVTYPDRPDKGRPNLPGYGGNRPTTLPGDVTNHPNLPGVGGGAAQRPNLPDRPGGSNRPSIVDRGDVNIGNRPIQIGGGNQVNVGNVNVGGRNQGLNRPATRPVERRDWDANRWGGNNSVWGNNVNISGNNVNVRINNNFRYNNNFACRPNYWGARPWWGASNYHVWHHGHWGYGWNSGYYHRHWWFHDDHDFATGFMWGIGVWSLGNLIYDMGYHSYTNPYPAPVVQNTYVTYTQPISVAAAANPPGDEAVAAAAEEKSEDALARSRTAFAAGDYLAASAAADEAIAANPGDITLHEYRALVLFALGKYGDAAGVLNPVLASGPGWSWETMSGFYGDTGAYTNHLAKLEAYTRASPAAADAHFLLGYHYLVCGHMANASVEFGAAAKLQPADTISRQLAALTADSVPDAGAGAVGEAPVTRPDPVSAEKLVGSWATDSPAGKIVFTMNPGGDFSWSCTGSENTSVMKGTYGLDDRGLLVLSTDDSQLVSAVSMDDDGTMKFILVGAPDGDPGLDFTKS